jgi:hypothetical protein
LTPPFAFLCRLRFSGFTAKLALAMRFTLRTFYALLSLALFAVPLSAQEKVAEGEYALAPARVVTSQRHWVLLAVPSGGYLLRSEIKDPKAGIRVLQLEELNGDLVPSSIGYELYLKDQAEPTVIVNCAFSNNSILCDGKSVKGTAARSKPYPYKGPVLFSVRDLSRFDFAWLICGALNMAHLDGGKIALRTVDLTGGAALELTDDINIAALKAVTTPNQKFTAIRPEGYTEWEFNSEDGDEETLSFVGTEDVKIGTTTMAARHYSVASGSANMNLWLAPPGILVKMTFGEKGEYVLTHYRQYRKLIPQIEVETPDHK